MFAVMITTELYWMNLEITLGLIACCLPNLPGLLKNVSVSQAIHSLRGRVKLNSSSSLGSSNISRRHAQDSELGRGVQD